MNLYKKFFEANELELSKLKSDLDSIRELLIENLETQLNFEDTILVVNKKNQLVGYLSFKIDKNVLYIRKIFSANSEVEDANKINGLGTNMVLYVVNYFNPSKIVICNILPEAEGFWFKVIDILKKEYFNISFEENSFNSISVKDIFLEK